MPCSSISTCTPGSVSTSSFFNISFSSFTYSQTICVFSAGIRISASHSLGIALSFNPPCKVRIPNGEREKIPYSRRPIKRSAFPCSLSISLPECPPESPVTIRESFFPVCLTRVTGMETFNAIPPAQPVRKIPSSSLSIFNMVCPVSIDRSMTAAPSIPISSSTVITTSNFGWEISSDSKIASAYATAIPSSPPSVVPSAFRKSPSTYRRSPSLSMSRLQSFSFSQTISMCP